MGKNIVEKILEAHLVAGTLAPGEEIAIRVDQTLTQDATGTMAYLEFEAMNVPRVRTQLSVSYVDHNMLQSGFENADDHLYLQTVAAKHGIHFSKPGNGICHQVHLERFGAPGLTLLGSDSHTPTGGGLGMIAIGVGGIDVAVAMAGGAFHLVAPKVVRVELAGELKPWVTAKDMILEVLRRVTVKGGVGRTFEYGGPGVATLTVPQRATITNMGAELGATTSIFPSDDATRQYLKAQGREGVWQALTADPDATYDETIEIDLGALEPLIAQPHMPDNVCTVADVAGTPIDQACVGSCTNSSFRDLMTVAAMLKGKKIHPRVSFTISPGSRQVMAMIARNGALADIVDAGARIVECACGPCIGMGQAPRSNGVSIRSFNRNFKGRSGTKDAQVYLASAEAVTASAVAGVIADPRDMGAPITISDPEAYDVDDSMILPPSDGPDAVEVIRGPNIKPVPEAAPLPESIAGVVLLKVGDNITTDHIMPAGAKILPLRSNIPAISRHVFEQVDAGFADRALSEGGGLLIGGANYGQGSSREHAALAPMFLGVKAVLVKSFARIHRSNLINFGIVPLLISDADADALEQGDRLSLPKIRAEITGGRTVTVENRTKGSSVAATHDLTAREIEMILAGGLLNYTVSKG